ncbi:MAG: hypothetical protein QOF82_574 [Frankiales bacterium]|nr:hypothetical protein [Frankiales bacterium]
MNQSRTIGLLLALVTACISGVSVFVNGYGVKHFASATTYTTAKNLVAAVLLLLVVSAVAPRRGLVTRPSTARSRWGLLAIALVGGSIPFILFFEGLSRATSVQTAFLQKTLVVWVALLAIPLLGEKIGAWHWGALGLLVVGQAALTGATTGPLHIRWGSGEVMVLAATLLWSVEVVIAKRLLAELSSWTIGVARMVLGSLLLVGWAVVRGNAGQLVHLSGGQMTWVLVTGLLLGAYVATWFAALAKAQAVDVTAVLVVGAVITALLSALVKGTPLQPQLGGLGLVLAGTAVLVWRMAAGPRPVAAS